MKGVAASPQCSPSHSSALSPASFALSFFYHWNPFLCLPVTRMGREGRSAEELRALAADQDSNPGAYRE